jgi:hypothetical protein
MMNLIRNTSPVYKGNAQPAKNGSGGLLSQLLCYLFGGGTPAYKGKEQSAPKTCGSVIFPDAPVYKAEPVVDPTTTDQAPELNDSDGDESEMDEFDDDSNAEQGPIQTMGKITIVVG